jgi:hypothetical protein
MIMEGLFSFLLFFLALTELVVLSRGDNRPPP